MDRQNPAFRQQLPHARMGDFAYGAGQFFDMLNIFFSNNVLLRVAYIPPNVIIDPILGATMDTESLFMTRNLFPGWQTSLQQHAARRKAAVMLARTAPRKRKKQQ